ncbi:MAG: hypothetical protein KatS3mg068_0282 [Candidatus Sericytochromatia bacterium]|nr:MAG: hypothetical protein KatS3mg068_0282 [Candidatus Sericytochromatia bacterium]
MIAGLKKYDSGNIFINGYNVDNLPPEKRNMAYLPQDNSLFPHLNVFENIYYGLRFIKHLTYNQKIEKINEISKILKIEHLIKRNTDFLSGGEKQRVALARALVTEKKIILLDEPTSALNESLQEELCFFLKDLQKKYSLTIIMTTHNIDNTFILADYIHFIDKGKIIFSSLKENINKEPININFAKFLGIKNFFEIEKIEKVNEYNILKLKDVNLTLNIKASLPSKNFIIGINPNEIRIIKKEEVYKNVNTFEVKVISIIYKYCIALIKSKDIFTDKIIFIEIPIYYLNKFQIKEDSILKCKIKEESIKFII